MNDRARPRANVAVALDAAWVITLVILWPDHATAAAFGMVVLALGLLAKRLRRLGYALAVVRLLGALVLVVPAVDNIAFLLLPLVAALSAANGVVAARSGAQDRRHTRALIAARSGVSSTRRTRLFASVRTEEVGSAIIHFAFVALMITGLLVDGRFAAAVGFVIWWIVFMWGTTAVHEAGHAIAALRTGNDVPDVSIGIGLTLFRVGRVTVGAIGFVGHTHWAVNESSMTSRKELCIALGGPAANLVAGAALLAVVWVRWDALVFALCLTQFATALLNLVPYEHSVHGHPVASDGARAFRLLRAGV